MHTLSNEQFINTYCKIGELQTKVENLEKENGEMRAENKTLKKENEEFKAVDELRIRQQVWWYR